MGISGRETKAKNITSILPLSLRFRAKKICRCRFAFAQKRSAAVASLSRKKDLSLPLGFRAKKGVTPRNSSGGKSHAGTEINFTLW
ncbi:hypothetical protein [Lysinibacillus xylanilyticus]|uniref:hypothetical protein n=1 Tax=Lysinibacillus xylanilyticus TaxID=582475 RepID=UPI0036DADF87